MRPWTAVSWLLVPVSGIIAAGAIARPDAGSLPPGRQYRLKIEGDNTVTFLPQVGLNPLRIDYLARVEYLVNTRSIGEAEARSNVAVKKRKTGRKAAGAVDRVKRKGVDAVASKAAGAVDVAIHSSEMRFQQNGQIVLESRISRARFQGRIRPDVPVLNVSYRDAPPALQEVLRTFDTTAASVLLDDRSNALARRVRSEGPLHAVIETLLSIHTPIPRDVAFWEAPTQLAMGHGQTAKGLLRFEKAKERVADRGLLKVKVSGVLEAEGAIVGNFVKDGTYTVTGEQSYDPRSREWKSARWSVVVKTELANAAGITLAHAQGNMLVETKALDDLPASAEGPTAKP